MRKGKGREVPREWGWGESPLAFSLGPWLVGDLGTGLGLGRMAEVADLYGPSDDGSVSR